MKTRLAILIAGLIFLATPMLAAAHGGDRHDDGAKHYKGQAKDRHDGGAKHYQGKSRDRYDSDRYRQGRDHRWERQAKKQHKRQLHESRRNPRYVVHQYNPRPYYANPAVLIGFPRIVFHLGW